MGFFLYTCTPGAVIQCEDSVKKLLELGKSSGLFTVYLSLFKIDCEFSLRKGGNRHSLPTNLTGNARNVLMDR